VSIAGYRLIHRGPLDVGMPALLTSSGRPGFYFRVLQEGEVGADDQIVKVGEATERMTVAEINALLYSPNHARDRLERALRIEALSPGWRWSFEALSLRSKAYGTYLAGATFVGGRRTQNDYLDKRIKVRQNRAFRLPVDIERLGRRHTRECQRAPRHSITVSARARNVSGNVSPIALAVLRLTMSSNLVGNCTGSSLTLAPRSSLST
jgi:hypothetical protein